MRLTFNDGYKCYRLYDPFLNVKILFFPHLATGKYHSGYPIVLQVKDASAYLNISNLEQNGIWDMISMLGANVQWTSGFYHSKYQCTIGNFWSLYVNQKEHSQSYLKLLKFYFKI